MYFICVNCDCECLLNSTVALSYYLVQCREYLGPWTRDLPVLVKTSKTPAKQVEKMKGRAKTALLRVCAMELEGLVTEPVLEVFRNMSELSYMRSTARLSEEEVVRMKELLRCM